MRKRTVLLLLLSVVLQGKALDLARDGKAVSEIVVAKDACPSTKTAALELKKYLKRMSGAEIPVVSEPTGSAVPIYLGKSVFTDRLGIRTDDIRYDGFRIVVTPDYAVVAGVDDNRPPIPRNNTDLSRWEECRREWAEKTGSKTDPRLFYRDPRHFIHGPGGVFSNQDATGTLYGVYDLLENLGVRFYMPVEGLGQVVPRMETITLPETNRKEEPDLAARYFSLNARGSGLDECWYKQLRTGGIYDLWPGHTSMGVMTEPKKEFLVYKSGRPVNANAETKLPRLASPELRAAVADYLIAFHENYPELHDLPIGQPDGWTVLDDRDAAAGWDKREEGEKGCFSDYAWDFILDVAKRVEERAPGAKFNTMSYAHAKNPPKSVGRIPGNIGIFLTQGSAQWRGDDPEDLRLRREWEAKAPESELFVYDYYLAHNPGRNPPIPVIFLENMDRNFKAMTPQFKGVFCELSHDDRAPYSKYRSLLRYPVLNALPYYIHGKLAWNRNTDVKSVAEEYYRLFFGPAAAEMREFYTFAGEMWRNPPPSNAEKREMVRKYFEILSRASAKAGESDYGRRIALIAEEMEPAKKAFSDERTGRRIPAFRRTEQSTGTDSPLNPDGTWCTAADNLTGTVPDLNRTFVKLFWTEGSLKLEAVCMERKMESLHAAVSKEAGGSEDIYLDDNLEIYVESTSGWRVKLVVNPNGAFLTKLFSSPDVADVSWLPKSVFVKKESGRWTVEADLGSFGGASPSMDMPWGVNVCRQRLAGGRAEFTALAPTGGRFDDFRKHGNLSLR